MKARVRLYLHRRGSSGGRPAAGRSRPSSIPSIVASVSLCALLAGIPACQVPPRAPPGSRTAEARGEDLLQIGDPNDAIAAFRRMADAASTPEEKARAQIGIARAYAKLGNYRKSLDALYAARTDCELGPLRETVDKLVGDVSFLNGDFGIARTYLERSLRAVPASERAAVLAKLHVCARRTSDLRAADRYLADIPRPYGPEVAEILRKGIEPAGPTAPPTPPHIVKGQAPPPPRRPEPEIHPDREVIPRSSWGARPVIMRRIDPMGDISRITVHHTGGPTFWGRSASETAYEIRKIQRVHQGENQWADIGYHFIIDRVGRIWQGRPLSYQGAHAHGAANRGNIGIVVLGNYMRQELTDAQVRTLRAFVFQLCAEYGIPPGRVYTHGEIRHGLTDCPGPAVARIVKDIRRSMASSRHAD